MTTPVKTKQAIRITESAAENVHNLLVERNLETHHLRIYVAGIGCAGPQYGLAFDENPRETDTIIEENGIKILVDPSSLAYLDGATIDFVNTPQQTGFKIDNPNPLAAAACGTCGTGCG